MEESTAPKGPAEPALSDLLDTREVAAATGLTVNTLESYRSLRRRGMDRGPEFVTKGRAVLYPRAAVEAFLSQNREG